MKVALLIIWLLLIGGEQQPSPRNVILRAKTTAEQEKVIRTAIAEGNLESYAQAYLVAYKKSRESRFLYGVLRTQFYERYLLRYIGSDIHVVQHLEDSRPVIAIIETVPAVLKNDAYALAGYYRWVDLCRETRLRPAKESHEWATARIGGRTEQVMVTRTMADPAKQERLTELFCQAEKLAPNNPMVLQIASEREKTVQRSYSLMKAAYEMGGKWLFPEQALYAMFDLATKLGRPAEAEESRHALEAWLAANPQSVFKKMLRIDHPSFKH
ncbi:MAG TPA: hypothetical protein VHE55_16500 [Fimbriimonadaceae bacterium]|nr:hypothetical protein [Fimbriimonadaceae bacterium]